MIPNYCDEWKSCLNCGKKDSPPTDAYCLACQQIGNSSKWIPSRKYTAKVI